MLTKAVLILGMAAALAAPRAPGPPLVREEPKHEAVDVVVLEAQAYHDMRLAQRNLTGYALRLEDELVEARKGKKCADLEVTEPPKKWRGT